MLAWPRWTTRINQHFPLRYLTWLLCGALALFFALTWTAGLTGGVLVLVLNLALSLFHLLELHTKHHHYHSHLHLNLHHLLHIDIQAGY